MKIHAEADSSLIESIDWKQRGKDSDIGELIVNFKPKENDSDNGEIGEETAIYKYQEVPLTEVLDMLASESLGKYFCKNIRNIYKAKRL